MLASGLAQRGRRPRRDDVPGALLSAAGNSMPWTNSASTRRNCSGVMPRPDGPVRRPATRASSAMPSPPGCARSRSLPRPAPRSGHRNGAGGAHRAGGIFRIHGARGPRVSPGVVRPCPAPVAASTSPPRATSAHAPRDEAQQPRRGDDGCLLASGFPGLTRSCAHESLSRGFSPSPPPQASWVAPAAIGRRPRSGRNESVPRVGALACGAPRWRSCSAAPHRRSARRSGRRCRPDQYRLAWTAG